MSKCKWWKKQVEQADALIVRLEAELAAAKAETRSYSFGNNRITSARIKTLIPEAGLSRIYDFYLYTINKKQVQQVLEDYPDIDSTAYVANNHDCDDFAFRLKGVFSQPSLSKYTFGYAMGIRHVFNFFIDKNEQIWLVEPQTAKIWKYEPFSSNSSYHIKEFFI